MRTSAITEKRRIKRHRHDEVVLWRDRRTPGFSMGQLLESSWQGLAFMWRGEAPPRIGALIDLHVNAPDLSRPPRQAVVRRVKRVHEDLLIIGVELIVLGPFPVVASAARPDLPHDEASGESPSPIQENTAARRQAPSPLAARGCGAGEVGRRRTGGSVRPTQPIDDGIRHAVRRSRHGT